MTASVVELAARRKPAYNPTAKRHSWTDVDGGHECGFCGVVYHSEQDPDSGAWWKAWSWRGKTGRCLRMPACPGPNAEAEAAGPQAAPPPVVPLAKLATPAGQSCSRCTPPCGERARLYLGGWYCDRQAGLITAARIARTNGDVA